MVFNKFFSLAILITVSFFLLSLEISCSPLEEAEDFTLTDYNGKKHTLSSYKESKAIVIIFVSTECPVSNAYNSRMEKLNKEFSQKGITFLGINSNKAESVERIKEHSADNGLTFSILKDEKNVVADKFDASATPEVYVLSGSLKVLYHGRIDNSKDESEVESQDLKNALNEILEGNEVTKKETKAFGCSIKRV
ncbi:MAG: thioredoxin family protein [Ignavibacteriales bacterium]